MRQQKHFKNLMLQAVEVSNQIKKEVQERIGCQKRTKRAFSCRNLIKQLER